MAYTATATTTAGRNGHVESSDGVLHLDLAPPGSSKPNATNPEQLFAAGYSACFGGAVDYAATLEKIKVGPVTVTADVTLTAGASGFDLSVVLKTKVEGVDHATAEKLAHKAHTEICPYSKATRGNIDVTIEIL